MPSSNPLAVIKRLVLNTRAPQFQRVSALRLLGDSASLAMLRRVADDPTSPGRLAGLAANMFIQKVAERQIARQTKDDCDANQSE